MTRYDLAHRARVSTVSRKAPITLAGKRNDLTVRPFGLEAPRVSKYRAVKTVVDGIVFDSKREAARYGELRLLETAGYIRQVELQPEFAFLVDGKPIFKYLADFRYFEGQTRVVEDVKGVQTPVFRLKRKLIEAQFGIKIRVVA